MVGIDYSMTCPAACCYAPGSVSFWFAHHTKHKLSLPNVTSVRVEDASLSVSKRAKLLAEAFLTWAREKEPALTTVAIEDYAFAATGRVFHIGENTGILKFHLDCAGIEYLPIPPTVVKKFATGKGNADKFKMTCAFVDAYPAARAWIPALFPRTDDIVPPKSPLSDMADAYWIARYQYENA
jgi:Holliday junction resolvasome RuvABC endonuclease subunit